MFYITSTQQNITSVIYSGLFELYDSTTNLNNLATSAAAQLTSANSTAINAAAPIITVNNAANVNVGKVINRVVSVNQTATSVASPAVANIAAAAANVSSASA